MSNLSKIKSDHILEDDKSWTIDEKEGWGIFYIGRQDAVHNLYEIQRIDELKKFKDDDEALIFVATKALESSASKHRRVMLYLRDYSPNELDRLQAIAPELYSRLSHEIL